LRSLQIVPSEASKFGDCRGNFTDFTPTLASQLLKFPGEQRFTIMNQIAFAEQDSIHRVGRISADLAHPESIGSRTDAGDLHLPCRQIDEDQNQETLQTFPRPDLDAEEIGRQCCA
jgi:hypothetical protein